MWARAASGRRWARARRRASPRPSTGARKMIIRAAVLGARRQQEPRRPRSTTPRFARAGHRGTQYERLHPSRRHGILPRWLGDLRAQKAIAISTSRSPTRPRRLAWPQPRPRARVSGAANTLLFQPDAADGGIHGENTDGAGLLAALARSGRRRGRQRRRDGRRRRRGGRRGRGAHARGCGVAAVARRPDSRSSCARACSKTQRARVTVTPWTGDELARALDGATVLVSAVPAAAWAIPTPPPDWKRSRAAPPCWRWPTAPRRRSPPPRSPRRALRRRPRHAGPPGRARDHAGAWQDPAPGAIVRSRPRLRTQMANDLSTRTRPARRSPTSAAKPTERRPDVSRRWCWRSSRTR